MPSNASNYKEGLGDPSRTLEGNSRKSSESVSGVVPEFCQNFLRKVPAVLGVWPKNEKWYEKRHETFPPPKKKLNLFCSLKSLTSIRTNHANLKLSLLGKDAPSVFQVTNLLDTEFAIKHPLHFALPKFRKEKGT